jgi:hypothetical protein
MFALVMEMFGGKNTLKNWLIYTLDKVIYCKGTILSGVYKTYLHFTK